MIIKQRNEASVDNCIDQLVILPASGNIDGVHGGTINTRLYSIRSPSKLPVKIHLWRTSTGDIMVRNKLQSMKLTRFLQSLEVTTWNGPVKQYKFWKSLKLDDKFLNHLNLPAHLCEAICHRWWMMNGFKFLDLPAELREMVISYAMGDFAEPYASAYRSCGFFPLPTPNVSLVQVNKQLYAEAMPILLSQVTFVFRKQAQLFRFCRKISIRSLHALQSLELRFDHHNLLNFFGAPTPVFGSYSSGPSLVSSDSSFKPSFTKDNLHLRYISIIFPHPRRLMNNKRLRHACQRNICLWIWAAARIWLRRIPSVEFEGFIKDDQKEEWLQILDLERQGICSDPDELKKWQRHIWSSK